MYCIYVDASVENLRRKNASTQTQLHSITQHKIKIVDSEILEIKRKSFDDENDENGVAVFKSPEGQFAGLKVSKLLFVTGLSFLDVITDFLFGFKLLSQDDGSFYGYLVLASCWVPGLVAVIHMVAYYRKDYAEKIGEFSITLTILFLCFPLAPFLSFVISLCYFNEPATRKIGRVEKIINLAIEMEGCIEAPLQISITIFCIMKGYLSVPWASSEDEDTIRLSFNAISFNGVLPFITLTISMMSILKGTLTVNIFNVLLVNQKQGYLPFFIHSILFRPCNNSSTHDDIFQHLTSPGPPPSR